MRIAIDATPVTKRLKGTGRVLVGLLRALPEVEPGWSFIALTTSEGLTVLASMDTNAVSAHAVASGSATIWEMRGLPREASRVGADIVLTLREFVGFGGPPTILHVAEPPGFRLSARGRPLKHRAKDRVLDATLGSSLRRAARVTASSSSTARWLQGKYGLEAPVIPPAVDHFFTEVQPAPADDGEYFLHLASGDARDNSESVLRAFHRSGLPSEGLRLVVVGTPPSTQSRLADLATRLGLTADISFTGWVSDANLRALYRGAVSLVQPANFEGFAGLQQLEALAQGTPPIVIDAPGVSDVLADSAEIVPADEDAALARAMRVLWEDHDRRAKLGRAGRRLVEGLTWERSAEAFAGVMRSVASAPGR